MPSIARMTLEEKLAQLVGFWLDQRRRVVAPMQGDFGSRRADLEEFSRHGLGHLTRVVRHPSGRRRPSARRWLWDSSSAG